MKKLFILFTLLLQLLSPIYPQQAATVITPSLKYGKPSKEELLFTTYTPDTTATALYLFHQGQSNFTYHDGFQLITEHWIRIKILKPQGTAYADVSVPFYAPTDKEEGEERASEVEGCSYNMENGKCVKTPMKRESISFERIDNRYKILKFSLPAVKEGTIIEYHYKLYSDYFIHIDNWMMQEELPMLYNQYKITIPNVFIYNIELRGKDYIQMKQKESALHATAREGGTAGINKDFTILAQETTFISQNLPAIRQDEPYCWCPEDYKVQISFDLQGTNFPGKEYEPYSQKWEDVDKQLLKPENTQFGEHLSLTNPFRPETKQAYNSEMNFEEKIICAFQVLKKKMAWNGRYQLYSKELEKVIKKGSGSNADLNFILISILKDFGLEAYPVVMSRRSSGMLPYNFPSLQKLNTFFVAIHDINKQKYVFLDSSMDVPAFNILPLELSVNKARILSRKEKEENKWVNVMALSNNKSFMKIDARIEGDQVKGHRSTVLYGQEAVEYQANAKHKQDSLVSNPENKISSQKEQLTVTNLKVKKQENDWALIEEEFDFVLQVNRTDNHLYINPMLFPQLKSNPFIQTERVLPIEFPYPYKFTMLSTLTLPEGYEVEELPQPQAIRSEGDGLQCKYMIQKQGNTILLNYVFHLKGYIFLSEQYKQLQELWTKVIEKNNALIVLKKI